MIDRLICPDCEAPLNDGKCPYCDRACGLDASKTDAEFWQKMDEVEAERS